MDTHNSINQIVVQVQVGKYNKAMGMKCQLHGKAPVVVQAFNMETGAFTLGYCCDAFALQVQQALK